MNLYCVNVNVMRNVNVNVMCNSILRVALPEVIF